MALYDLLARTYEISKYTIHLTRGIEYEGLHYERNDTIHDVESIEYRDQRDAEVTMFSCKAKGHLEVWAYLKR